MPDGVEVLLRTIYNCLSDNASLSMSNGSLSMSNGSLSMSNGSLSMSNRSLSMSDKPALNVEPPDTNIIEIENGKKKEIIQEQAPPNNNTPRTTTDSKPVVRLSGKQRENALEYQRQLEVKKANQMRTNQHHAVFLARQKQYASSAADRETISNLPVTDKVECLVEGIKALSMSGCFDYDSGHMYSAPVCADNRGITLAEELLTANPSLTVAPILKAIEHLAYLNYIYKKPEEGEWDDYRLAAC